MDSIIEHSFFFFPSFSPPKHPPGCFPFLTPARVREHEQRNKQEHRRSTNSLSDRKTEKSETYDIYSLASIIYSRPSSDIIVWQRNIFQSFSSLWNGREKEEKNVSSPFLSLSYLTANYKRSYEKFFIKISLNRPLSSIIPLPLPPR